jgi:serine/tyrosine/threonine adenylyltransferase
MLQLESTYTSLDARLFTFAQAAAMPENSILLYNSKLAANLGLSALEHDPACSALLSGQKKWEGSRPFAQAYAGHQFGHFTMLGDGRALVLGEWKDPQGQRYDIQLKGSGPTAYSRRGDGLATTSAMLREYLISECMAGLGISTSRSLAVVDTGLPVFREFEHRGAVLTRIAKSHIRVGTFEYVSQLQDPTLLRAFTDYVIARHCPEAMDAVHPTLYFLNTVIAKQVELIVQWMRVGFIHGVMNTDNMSIAGETIDYGPCAFMDSFDWGTVFSSIDRQGRYAYGRQAPIAQWNLACLASALLPLLHDDHDQAIKMAQECINGFVPLYEKTFADMMRQKLGFIQQIDGDLVFIDEMTAWMQSNEADFTQTFLAFESHAFRSNEIFRSTAFETLIEKRQQLLKLAGIPCEESLACMRKVNPYFIPRNELVERALTAASTTNDYTLFNQLLSLGQQPYRMIPEQADIYKAPEHRAPHQTFCGT